jgi:branched-chain amino acid transport system permease protein
VNDILFYLVAGLGIGSLYAMLGASLVVVYKGSGVINFAMGAMAMYGVATFDRAWNKGEMFLPWVDLLPTHGLNLPVRITLGDSGEVPMGVAFVVALAMATIIGFGAHFLVFRPLRHAAPLGKVVASLGLALYLQGVALLNFGTSYPTPKSIYPDPDKAFDNFLGLGNPFPRNSLFAFFAAVVVGAIVWGAYKFTRFGMATRAAASNEKGAVLLGYSPQLLAAANWVAASIIATLAAILVGPIQGPITPVGLTALIVPALAAALIGGLRSVPIAMVGGIGLGMVNSLLQFKQGDWFEWTRIERGVTSSLPLIIIVAVLFLRGRSLPVRGVVEEQRLPASPTPVRIPQHIVIWTTVVVFVAFAFENSGIRTVFAGGLQTALVFMVIMLSLTVLTGYTGQISLFQMSLAGVAAFFMARMMANGSGQGTNLTPVAGPGFPWPLAALAGIAVAVLVGLLVGLPAVRIRGVQLAVVTIAAAIAIQDIYLDNDKLTGLISGSPAQVDAPGLFGLDIGARSERAQNENPGFAIFEVIVLVLLAVAIANIRRSGLGRRFLSVRANERAAAAAGINVARTKLLAFGLSAAIAGTGGVMLAFKQVEVASANFPYTASLAVLAFAYLGGITSINGAVVGGLLVAGSLAPVTSNYFYASSIERYLGIIGGIGMILTAIIHPEGIAPYMQGPLRHAGRWLTSAIPGARTLLHAYIGAHRRLLSVVFTVLWVGLAVWLYQLDNTIVDNNLAWALLSGLLVWLILLGVASRLGGIQPTFAEASRVWASALRRFGPTALIGYVAGWLIWPVRSDQYSGLYMPLIAAGLALMIRSIGLRIYRATTRQVDPMLATAAVHAPAPPTRPEPERAEEVV